MTIYMLNTKLNPTMHCKLFQCENINLNFETKTAI